VDTQLVRNQRRVSVDYLVRTLFLQDTLDRPHEKVESDPDNLAADRPHNRRLAAVELACPSVIPFLDLTVPPIPTLFRRVRAVPGFVIARDRFALWGASSFHSEGASKQCANAG
jgi:hypothetical protein